MATGNFNLSSWITEENRGFKKKLSTTLSVLSGQAFLEVLHIEHFISFPIYWFHTEFKIYLVFAQKHYINKSGSN